MTESSSQHDFATLTPDVMLDAIESTGVLCNGQFLALNSYENRVFQVGIEEGAPLVVKFYRPNRWSDEAILEEHQFTLELSQQEIPVIPPLVDGEGITLHHYQGLRFSLYLCRGGRPPELDDPDHLEQLGRFIGRIHLLGASDSFRHRPNIDIKSYLHQPSRYVLDHDFLPHHLLSAYESLLLDLEERINTSYSQSGTVKNIRLHGDCHPGNILWRDDGPQIVDFDDARTGPGIQDLWMFLSGDRRDMTVGLSDLLEGYNQFYDFNPSELHILEALRSLRLVHYAGWLAKRWDDPAFPAAFPWFDSVRFWEDHILTLREQIARMDEPPLVC
jgi:Ser/Thr protein kinase RdoA (MazF antagonist)